LIAKTLVFPEQWDVLSEWGTSKRVRRQVLPLLWKKITTNDERERVPMIMNAGKHASSMFLMLMTCEYSAEEIGFWLSRTDFETADQELQSLAEKYLK